MSEYNPILGDINYRVHFFTTWLEKVLWEVMAISNAIDNLDLYIKNLKGEK